jgi:hypothetical protein
MNTDPVPTLQQYPTSPPAGRGVAAPARSPRSVWHPRWPLLAAILFTPATLVGYAVKIYYLPHVCTFGRICQLDTIPGVDQVALIWLGYLLLWGLAYAVGRKLDGPTPPRPYTLAAALYAMSRYQPVRGLLAVLGLAALGGVAAAIAAGQVDPAGFAMASIVIFVAARVVTYAAPAVP